MDFQRYLLIGAIAALSFMLLTEWVDFREQKANAIPVEQRYNGPTAAGGLPTDDITTGINNPPPTSSALDDDLPKPEMLADQATSLTPDVDLITGSLIRIQSDVLQLTVDLEGGDVVESALLKFPLKLANPDVPMLLLEQSARRTYVAQSGLIGTDGIDSNGRARFRAQQNEYVLTDDAQQLVVDLVHQSDSPIKVIKRFTLRRGDYLIDVEYLVENQSQQRWQANLFGQLKRDSSPDPSSDTPGMTMAPFLGAALTTPEKRFHKFKFSEMAKNPYQAQLPGGWVAMIQHYFLTAWIPNPNLSHTFSTRVTQQGFNIAGFTSPALNVDPGQTASTVAQLYIGPKDQYRLADISPHLDLSVDYGWLWWIAQPLFWLLHKLHSFVGNWGVAIILLTVIIKTAFFRLSATSYRSMANMRRVQPQLMEIRELYADDKAKQSQEMMNLYKKEKINPLGGCLPILVQMPVFIALYWVLMESVELRQAPFALWIQDLSLMDPYFVMPLLMGVSMWFMQKLNPPPPDPLQAKIMQWLPVIFTFFFIWFPAGLVLYWLVNNLLSIAQQWFITRQIEKAAARKT